MKKILTVFLMAILCLTMTACGGEEETPSEPAGIQVQEKTGGQAPVFQKSVTIPTSQSGADDGSFYEAVQSEGLQSSLGYSLGKVFQEDIPISDGVAAVSEVALVNEYGEQCLVLEVANDTGNSLYVSADRIAVNGLVIESGTWTGKTLNPGKKGLITLRLNDITDESCLEALGIDQIGEVGLRLVAEDDDGTELDSTQFTIPLTDGVKTVEPAGEAVYEQNGLAIYPGAITQETGSYSDDYHMILLVKNTETKDVWIGDDYDSLSIGGFMVDYYCSTIAVPAGSLVALDISIHSDEAADAGITEPSMIKSVEMGLEVYDENYRTLDNLKLQMEW